ncbi:Metallo-dependent hydrolase [Lentinus tigrinus ALCF2SS1-7]|uniref:Metallo-dependent hydrolase n=1 Tax=Lentinus tigrinus ALCF2SS1-6 TaxID=1328759 RepID=A0A5C2STE8_9APHY|nr:Metallo-dependent hydrolase [Lentinus tigrinus ALCF2SS1-6]RPD80340.1 Metallo-dependent hydrolase [Lentinus tigrinus ALCF2SS1-7]
MSMIFYGALVTPVSLTAYRALPRALLAVSRETGNIEWVEDDVPTGEVQDVLARHGFVSEAVDIVELKLGEFLMPGFIDTHIHAPQIPNIGSGQQHELLDWLSEVTFPMESRFADPSFAKRAYTAIIKRTIDYGSTTCCYYGTLHLEGTNILADVIHNYGQRAFVGKCNMDRNSPDYYVEPSPEASITATRDLITHIRSLPPAQGTTEPLVRPILTPRFAISCTSELLSELGKLAAADPSLAIQTHISENESEIVFTKQLFPASSLPAPPVPLPGAAKVNGTAKETTYAGVYDAFGLLRENTVLAHAVHLEEAEVEIIKARRAGVSHCPTSNFNLRSGCARIGMLLDRGVKVGLGTDVSGGFSPSILTAVQHASMCSKVVAMRSSSPPPHTHFTDRQLPVPTLLYLATLGGAEVCDMQSRIGSLAPGKAFDALVVSIRNDVGNPAVWGADLDEEFGVRGSGGEHGDEGGRGKTDVEELEGMLERFLFCGDDRNVRRVYVQGKLIGGKEFR